MELRGQVRALREQAEVERESVREQSSYVDNLRGEVVQGRDQRNHLQAHILRWDTPHCRLLNVNLQFGGREDRAGREPGGRRGQGLLPGEVSLL